MDAIPIKAVQMEQLLAMRLIEMRDDLPMLTNAGLGAVA
jgi:hypothetical protein